MKKGWSVLFVLSVLGVQHLFAAPEDEVKGVLERYIRAAQARLLHDGQDIANPLASSCSSWTQLSTTPSCPLDVL